MIELVADKFDVRKSTFHKRRNELVDMGHYLEPVKDGRHAFYNDEQCKLIEDYFQHLADNKPTSEFPRPESPGEPGGELAKSELNGEMAQSEQNGEVERKDEHYQSPSDSEYYVQANRENRLDEEVQLESAQRVLLKEYYTRTGKFNLPGLLQEVEEATNEIHKTTNSQVARPKQLLQRLKGKG